MGRYFQFEYDGAGFELFGPAHLWTVVILAVFFVFYLRAGKAAGERTQQRMRWGIALFLVGLDLTSHVYWWANGVWNPQSLLPLHMCSAMTYIMAYAFLTHTTRLYPLVYFLGIAGAIQAIITPDAAQFGFPHFRFFDSLLSHAGLVLGGLWVVLVERVRPTLQNLVETLAGLNLYALVLYFFNRAIGSNYLYVNGKPDVASAMDFMPEWPWYILVLEALVLIVLTLMWLPFARARRAAPEASGDVSDPD